MRSTMLAILIAVATGPAFAQDADKTADDAPNATDAVADETQAKSAAQEQKEFTPPPGYRVRKRGDLIIFCRKETPSGSRFAVENCYTAAQLAEIQRQNEEATRDFDRSRRVCSNPATCGAP